MADYQICKIDGCGKHVHSNGMCSMHAERTRKHGSPHKGAFRPKGTCTLPDCDRIHYGHGYCLKHYKRWSKYGDPLGGSTEWGAAQRFVSGLVEANTQECIIYPFYRNQDGYGWMKSQTGNIGAHVYAAILCHGDKPTLQHEACHSCGNGHLGCVNPRHIYWGTRSDNMKDAYRHGKQMGNRGRYGERASATKYPDAVIEKVRAALARGETQTSVATMFNMSQSHVNRIKHGARAKAV